MCGLLAIHTTRKNGFFKADMDEFQMMMHLTSFRGKHSTGIAGINLNHADRKSAIVKAVEAPHYVYGFNKTDEFVKRAIASYTTLIGHSRYATRGKIDAPNAHPYNEGHITLAHNGVINNYESLRDAKAHKDIDVDSHLIARLFSESSPIEVLEKIEGSYVFMWIDENLRTFNIARNYSRPLFMGKQGNMNLHFASERETLEWNEKRNKTVLSSIEVVEPLQIHTWTADSMEPTIEKYKPYTKVYPVSTYNANNSAARWNRDDWIDDAPYDSWDSPVKPRSLKRSEPDATTRDLINAGKVISDSNVFLGQKIVFSILDYTNYTSSTSVEGMSDEFPGVLFKATYNYRVEPAIFDTHEYLEVNVLNIVKTAPNHDHEFIVYGKPEALLKVYAPQRDSEPEDTKTLYTVMGEEVKVQDSTVLMMLNKPCEWCTCDHDKTSGTVLEKLIFDNYNNGLVCLSCSDNVRETWDKQKDKFMKKLHPNVEIEVKNVMH